MELFCHHAVLSPITFVKEHVYRPHITPSYHCLFSISVSVTSRMVCHETIHYVAFEVCFTQSNAMETHSNWLCVDQLVIPFYW